jgi:HEAT repeat protein
MTFAFRCPGCGHRFEQPVERAGKRARCKYCRLEFRIPRPASPPTNGVRIAPPPPPSPTRPAAPPPRAASAAAAFPPPPASAEFEILDQPDPAPPPAVARVDGSPIFGDFGAIDEPDALIPGVVDLAPDRPPVRSRFRADDPPPAGGKGGGSEGKKRKAGKKNQAAASSDPRKLDAKMAGKLAAACVAFVLAYAGVQAAYKSIARALGWAPEEAPAETTIEDMPIRRDVVARHAEVVKQIADDWGEMADLYAAIHNVGDLQTNAPRLAEIGDRMEAAEAKLKQLPPLNSAEDRSLLDAYGPDTERSMGRVAAELQRLQRDPAMANPAFQDALTQLEQGLNEVRGRRQQYEQMAREAQYVEVHVTNVKTPEAQAIVGRKLDAALRKVKGEGGSSQAHTDPGAGTIDARYSPVADPKKVAAAIDFGKVSVSGRKLTVEAYDVPAAELEAERKSNTGSGKVTRALAALADRDPNQQGEGLRLLGDVRREEPETLRSNAAAVAAAVAPIALEGEGFVVADAIRFLSELDAPEAVPPLLKALESGPDDARGHVARALEEMSRDANRRAPLEANHDAVVAALKGRMADADWGVRNAAMNSFRNLGWPELVPTLVESLADRDAEARGTAAGLLVVLLRENPALLEPEKDAILGAVAALAGTGPHPYGNQIYEFLRDCGWPEAIPTLVALMRSKDRPFRDAFVRLVFETARDRPQQLEGQHPALVAALAKVLEDREGGARADVARFLAESDWPEAMPALLHALPGPLAPEGREEAVRILADVARNKPERVADRRDAVLDALGQVVGLEDARSWRATLEFARSLHWPEALPTFFQALRARNAELRREAFNQVREAYRESPEPFKARQAEVAAALGGLLSEPDRNLRGEAAVLLLDFAGPDDVPALAEFLKGEDGSGRREVMQYLARTQDERAAPAIASWLGRDPGAALECLVALGEVAEPATLDALSGRDGNIRRHAALALKQIGTRKSLRPLQRVAQDPDGGVAAAAQEAIQAITSRGGK